MPPWLSTIIASIASIIVAVISSSWFSKKMLQHSQTDEILSRLDNIEKAQKEQTKVTTDLRDADIAIMEDRYNFLCKKAIHDKHISTQDLQAIHKLSVYYFRFDDIDGSGKALLHKVEELPIEEE